jgi:hypothetical protein
MEQSTNSSNIVTLQGTEQGKIHADKKLVELDKTIKSEDDKSNQLDIYVYNDCGYVIEKNDNGEERISRENIIEYFKSDDDMRKVIEIYEKAVNAIKIFDEQHDSKNSAEQRSEIMRGFYAQLIESINEVKKGFNFDTAVLLDSMYMNCYDCQHWWGSYENPSTGDVLKNGCQVMYHGLLTMYIEMPDSNVINLAKQRLDLKREHNIYHKNGGFNNDLINSGECVDYQKKISNLTDKHQIAVSCIIENSLYDPQINTDDQEQNYYNECQYNYRNLYYYDGSQYYYDAYDRQIPFASLFSANGNQYYYYGSQYDNNNQYYGDNEYNDDNYDNGQIYPNQNYYASYEDTLHDNENVDQQQFDSDEDPYDYDPDTYYQLID